MTEPSKQARDLLNRMQRYATFNEPRSVLELIDAALAEARQAGPQTTVTHELGKPGTCRVVSPDGALLFDGVDWSALTEARLERVANVTPRACSAQRERADKAERERDELAATVERVQDLCNEWAPDALGELVDADDYSQGAQDMLHECYGLVSRALRGKCSTCRMPNPCRKHEPQGEQ